MFDVSLRAINGLVDYTPPEALSRRAAERVGIVLSHEAPIGRLEGCTPDGRLDRAGSEALRDVLSVLSPAYHFSGHYHTYCPETEMAGAGGRRTMSVGLNQVMFFSRHAVITSGCFGILRASGSDEMTFEVVADDWFRRLRYGDVCHVL